MKSQTNQVVPIKDLTVWSLEIILLNVPRRVLHTSEDVIYSWGAVNPRLIFGTWAEHTVIFNLSYHKGIMPGFLILSQISIRFEVGFFFKSEKNLKSSVTQISAILKIISIHEIYANKY